MCVFCRADDKYTLPLLQTAAQITTKLTGGGDPCQKECPYSYQGKKICGSCCHSKKKICHAYVDIYNGCGPGHKTAEEDPFVKKIQNLINEQGKDGGQTANFFAPICNYHDMCYQDPTKTADICNTILDKNIHAFCDAYYGFSNVNWKKIGPQPANIIQLLRKEQSDHLKYCSLTASALVNAVKIGAPFFGISIPSITVYNIKDAIKYAEQCDKPNNKKKDGCIMPPPPPPPKRKPHKKPAKRKPHKKPTKRKPHKKPTKRKPHKKTTKRKPPPPPPNEIQCRVTGVNSLSTSIPFYIASATTVQDCVKNWKNCSCIGIILCGVDQGYFCSYTLYNKSGLPKNTTLTPFPAGYAHGSSDVGIPTIGGGCCEGIPCSAYLVYDGKYGTLGVLGSGNAQTYYYYKMGCKGNIPGTYNNNPNYPSPTGPGIVPGP